MKRLILSTFFLTLLLGVNAQKAVSKIFWSEDFSTGKMPNGWKSVVLNDSSSNWFFTDQPYPGSPGRNYQAPPIASASRGYHLQIAAGVRVGKKIRSWKKANIQPNAYIQTCAIDCSTKKSVVLNFQQNFFWNKFEQVALKSGLFVAVSNNGQIWKEYDVRYNIASGSDCPNPMNVELNITQVAAKQKTVYIRFWWRNMYQWYWMVDDIQLSEAFDADVQALDIVSHKKEGNVFVKNDPSSRTCPIFFVEDAESFMKI